MESFVYSVNASLPIFLTMAAGLGLRRLGLLDRHFADVADKFEIGRASCRERV